MKDLFGSLAIPPEVDVTLFYRSEYLDRLCSYDHSMNVRRGIDHDEASKNWN